MTTGYVLAEDLGIPVGATILLAVVKQHHSTDFAINVQMTYTYRSTEITSLSDQAVAITTYSTRSSSYSACYDVNVLYTV